MKKSRFTEAQIIGVLRQAEGGVPIPDLCREHSISTATFYGWRSKFGGMDASMASGGAVSIGRKTAPVAGNSLPFILN